MAVGKGEETALGTARGRFIESLPRKAIELRGAIALLTATPAAEGPREDMRRRLHTLYASALVFRNDGLAAAVKEGIDRLDAAREGARGLGPSDLELLTKLVKRLPELRGDDGAAGEAASSQSPTNATNNSSPSPASKVTARTLMGLAPVSLMPSPASAAPPSTPPVLAVPVSAPPSLRAAAEALPAPAAELPQVSEPAQASARPELTPPPPSADDFMDLAEPSAAQAAPEPHVPAVLGSLPPAALALAAGRERRPVLQRVLQVLVLSGLGEQSELQALLAGESLALAFVNSVRDLVESARESAPDVILADAALASAGGLLTELRSDPATDFVPVVLLDSAEPGAHAQASESDGPDDRVLRPFRPDLLLRTLGRVTGTWVEAGTALSALGDATLDEVAERMAEEVRRGLVDAAQSGRELRIPLGEGAEVLAAVWAAVARVRAFVADQSEGRVRFSDRPTRAAPALLALDPRGSVSLEPSSEGALRGRRILVVDDDTAVVWFFAGLLREEGATVLEATDGREALRAARRERPDLVISDILMPGLDGFALCRELKRDPLLSDVPVILISWQDDLLARMRELSAGASAYLRKEVGATQVLASVREVLKPRADLEARLAGEGEVRGSLEGTGIVPLLRSVRRARPDARVTVRDAWNLFECELREGRLAQLTRTASDGSFVRGERALPQLLGAAAGRFTVTVGHGQLKSAFEGTLDEVLSNGARELGAQLDALSQPLLARVARVVFDEDAYAALVIQTPVAVRSLIDRLHAGEAPTKLAKRSDASATIEAVLLDMVRRGAIRGVVGTAGEDLIAEARVQRARELPTGLETPRSIAPTAALNPVISVLRPPATELPQVLDPVAASQAAVAPAAPGPDPAPVEVSDEAPAAPLAAEPAAAAADAGPEPGPAPVQDVPAAEPSRAEPGPAVKPKAPPPSASDSGPIRRQVAIPRRSTPSDASELERGAAEERRSRTTMAAWAVALLGLFGVAFFAERALEPQGPPSPVEAIGMSPTPAPRVEIPPSAGSPAPADAPSAPLPHGNAALVPEDSGFAIYNGLLDPGLISAPNQGLLVVEAWPTRPGSELAVDAKTVGPLPAKLALSEGIHELAIRHGDAVSYRFVSVRPGKTWVLREP